MQRRAVFHRLVDLFGQRFQRIFRRQRPQRGAFVERIANLHLLKCLGEFAQEGVGNLFMQDKALRRGTDLPGVVEPRIHANPDGFVQVRIVQHHEHVVTAQFKGGFLDVLRRLRGHHAAGFFGAGQRCTLHAIVSNDVRHLLGRNKQVGPRPFRRPRLTHQVGKGLGAVRHDAGMLGDNGVTRRQVWRQNAHQLVIREVPRLNGHQHADGVMFHPRFPEFGLILHRGQELLRVVGVVAGDLRAQLHFATALFDELAHLLTGNFRQLLGALVDQIGKLMQHRQALIDVAFRPVRMVKRIGRLQRRFDIRVGMRGVFFDELVSGRIYCLISHVESPCFTA